MPRIGSSSNSGVRPGPPRRTPPGTETVTGVARRFDPASRAGGPIIEVVDDWASARGTADRFAARDRAEQIRALAIRGGGGAVAAYDGSAVPERDRTPHWIPSEVYERLDRSMPRIAGSGAGLGTSTALDHFFKGLMPQGATFDPGAGRVFQQARRGIRMGGGGGGYDGGGYDGGGFGARSAGFSRQGMDFGGPAVMTSAQRPYMPEFEDPSRQNYPTHRAQANTNFRMFYRMDGAVGTGVDMISALCMGDFKLVGEGFDGSIKQAVEESVELCQLKAKMPFFCSEFMVTGEVGPHLFYDDEEGIWVHLAFHNPDRLEVIDAPIAFVRSPPIVRFQPDDRLRQVLMLATMSPQIDAIRASMPDELVAAIMGRQHIELSPINFTFIARKLFPYDIRGTSILSRLWRVFMYEDAIAAASIAIARRAAAPLKVAKLGDAASGWVPGPEQEEKLTELLAQAETDVAAWLVWNYALNFELVGSQERSWKLEQSADYIERQKLMALGISKAFLIGEVTYACVQEGTPVGGADFVDRPVEAVRVGDRIRDRDGRMQTVTRAWREDVPPDLTEIEVTGGTALRATHHHRWPVWTWPRTCACACGKPVAAGKTVAHGHGGAAQARGVTYTTIDANTSHARRVPSTYDPMQELRSDELRPGDFLLVPRGFEAIDIEVTTASRARARLLGYYASEGCPFKDNGDPLRLQTDWSLSTDEASTWAVDIANRCAELNDDITVWQPTPEGERLHVRTARPGGWRLGNWLAAMGGRGALTKHFAAEVMRWPLALKEEVIRGAVRGDGWQTLKTCMYKGKSSGPYLRVGYSSGSRALVDQLWTMLVQLGFCASRHERTRHDTRDGWPKETVEFYLTIDGDAAVRLAELVWGEASLGRQVKVERTVRDRVRFDERYAYVPIEAVRRVSNDKPVYNLEVTGSHTYLVEGFATCNSTAGALTVFLQRLKELRQFFETTWLIPKFFRQMAEMNEWYRKSSRGPVEHGIRVRRSARELQDDLIVPSIEWARPLDPSVDAAQVGAYQTLQSLGVVISDATKMSVVNRDWEKEFRQKAAEAVTKAQIVAEVTAESPQAVPFLTSPTEGGGGGGMSPGLPPDMGMPPPGGSGDEGGGPPPDMGGGGAPGGEAPPGGEGPAPAGAGLHAGEGDAGSGGPGPWGRAGRYRNWTKPVVDELVQLLSHQLEPNEAREPWPEVFADRALYQTWGLDGDNASRGEVVDALEAALDGAGFPPQDVQDLRTLLNALGQAGANDQRGR